MNTETRPITEMVYDLLAQLREHEWDMSRPTAWDKIMTGEAA